MNEQSKAGMRELEERVRAWNEARIERLKLAASLRHAHWCPGDEDTPGHGWEHQESTCWTEEPTLRSTSLTCPECFSRPELEIEWREPRGLGCPR